jgi:hypothetical protein
MLRLNAAVVPQPAVFSLEEDNRVASQRQARPLLEGPDADHDLGAAEVGAAEHVHERIVRRLDAFEVVGVPNKRNVAVEVVAHPVVGRAETDEALFRLINLADAGEPVGALGGEQHGNEERNRPDPLEAVGQTRRPVAFNAESGAVHTTGDKATGAPAERDRVVVAGHADGGEETSTGLGGLY